MGAMVGLGDGLISSGTNGPGGFSGGGMSSVGCVVATIVVGSEGRGIGATRLKEIVSSSSITFIETDIVRSSTESWYFSKAPPSGVIRW